MNPGGKSNIADFQERFQDPTTQSSINEQHSSLRVGDIPLDPDVQRNKATQGNTKALTPPWKLAERVGFEPTVELPPRRFSRPELSTAQSPLHVVKDKEVGTFKKVPG